MSRTIFPRRRDWIQNRSILVAGIIIILTRSCLPTAEGFRQVTFSPLNAIQTTQGSNDEVVARSSVGSSRRATRLKVSVRRNWDTGRLRGQTRRRFEQTRATKNVKISETCVAGFSPTRKKPRLLPIAALLLIIFSSIIRQPAFAASASPIKSAAAAAAPAPPLGLRQLASAAVLVYLAGGLGLKYIWGLSDLARALLKAAARCALQLYLISGFLLTEFFVLADTRPVWVLLWITTTGALAASEAVNRVEYTYPRIQKHMVLAVWMGGLAVMGAAAVLRMLGPIQPWFSPRAWIPVSGMLFGNTLTASALAAGTMTKELATQRDQVEYRMSRGASWQEALQSVIRSTLTTALTPTINALSVTGIVHIPGMMTGQILAGQSPFQAAAYQVLIFFLIASQACTTVQVLMRLTVNELVDQPNDRLRTEELTRRVQDGSTGTTKRQDMVGGMSVRTFLSSFSASLRRPLPGQSHAKREPVTTVAAELTVPPKSQSVRLLTSTGQGDGDPILRIHEMKVARTNVDLSLELHHGDRIGIQGPSGIGKSQILRTLAGLEALDRSSLVLMGASASDVFMPEWRRRISLVPQNRPSLDGTPRDFYQQVCRYHSQQQQQNHLNLGDSDSSNINKSKLLASGGGRRKQQDPAVLAAEWGLAESFFDQSWSTLSGGESQRASLAIALALEPDVLLLDESTSALDEQVTLQVEDTLQRIGIPVVMVSHDSAQVDRFCNRRIDLGGELVQVA
jgi:uncharacterized protein (TIGR00245 family)